VIKGADLNNDVVKRHSDLLAQTYPAFSDAEMERREDRLKALMEARELDALMVVEAGRGGTATGWITGWPVTAEAVTVLGADMPRTMFIQHFNHIPLARKIAWRTDVQWGQRSCVGEGAKLLAANSSQVRMRSGSGSSGDCRRRIATSWRRCSSSRS
jgi:Xaa-Pro dipeptidase